MNTGLFYLIMPIFYKDFKDFKDFEVLIKYSLAFNAA
jgi:hypothetical protein